mgnify:CR=1 FL=1
MLDAMKLSSAMMSLAAGYGAVRGLQNRPPLPFNDRKFTPSYPTPVLYIHGINSRTAAFEANAQRLKRQGFWVWGYDYGDMTAPGFFGAGDLNSIVGDVEAFTLVGPDAVARRCSREENGDLFALAIGAFGIGVTEFATMGLLPQIAAELRITVPQAGHAVSLYALGVVVGAPALALLRHGPMLPGRPRPARGARGVSSCSCWTRRPSSSSTTAASASMPMGAEADHLAAGGEFGEHVAGPVVLGDLPEVSAEVVGGVFADGLLGFFE